MSRRALLVFLPFALTALVFAGTVSGGVGGGVSITASLQDGWYQSPVNLNWNVSPPTAITEGCDGGTIEESPLTQYSCSAHVENGQPVTETVNIGVDLTDPTIADPPDIGPLPATSQSGGQVNFGTPSASDNLSTPSVSCTPASGSTFPVGESDVTCTATDASGRTDQTTFKVTITPPNTPPTINVSGPATVPATGPGGGSLTYSYTASDEEDAGPPSVVCSHPVGAPIPVGGSITVTCTATDSDSATASDSLTQSAVDSTPPSFTSTPPSITVPDHGAPGETVPYSTPTATDVVDSSVSVTCAPPSPVNAPVGTTTVICTARDDANNTATTSFTITVNPNGAPTVTVTITSQQPAEATGPGGAPVSYTVSVNDAEDNPDPVATCSPPSGSTFAIGSTTITCSATDSGGVTGSGSATAVVQDKTPPVVTVPGNITAASTGPSGASVSFSASASDLVDGSVSTTCNQGSGSTFPVGVTLVSCSATDSHGNTGTNSFSVSVQDEDAPTVTVPASRTVEANGPTGSVVSYEPATATDTTGGNLNPVCFPPSGSTFGLGTWQVTCTATDAAGNVGSASFTIAVVDTSAPVLTIPGNLTVQSTGPVAATDSRIKAFLDGATATDIVDEKPTITTNAPSSFPIGATTVVFTATDAEGNEAQKSATVTVTPDPVGPQPGADTTPPANVGSVRAILGNLSVSLSWKPPANDFDHVDVVQSPGPGGGEKVVYSGKKKSFVARGLTNGVEYRFVVVAFDKAGNRASGVAVVALAQQQMLLAPPNGAVLSAAPLVKWKPVKGAKYYNAQIWFEPTGSGRAVLASAAARKVMSVWPTKTSFKMKKSWRFGGKKFTLNQGRYLLYIWPGVGPKSANRYGKQIVQAEFTISRG